MLTDKVIIITGGASGLGSVLVDEMIKNGAKVFFTFKNSKENALKIQEKYKDNVYAFEADASNYDMAINAVNKCIDHFGKIDILINNAASARDSSLMNQTYENFDYTIKNVLYPVFNYSKAVSGVFIENEHGKIINIGSINGMRGREGSIGYSSAKAAVEGFTKTMAKELGRYNVNCNVVAPGFINTDGQQKTSELIKKMVLDECAIKKLTEPKEVANLILFLCSDLSNNITGQVYKIDCGQYI